jgi:pimeloyl-ACP methyl ester carboxylesterase
MGFGSPGDRIASVTSMTHFASVDGARIAYDEEGDGPPIVLVHAGVTARGMWDDVVPLLATDHRVIRYDLRGFGETVEDEELPFMLSTDLIGVMDAAGVDTAIAVGVSMGGGAVLDACLTNPDRIRAAVAVNPGIAGFEADDGDWAIERFKAMRPAWDAGDFDEVARLEAEIWFSGPHRSLADMPQDMRDRMHQWLLTSYTKEPWSRQQDLDPPTGERLGEITVPTLAILGELDLPSLAAVVDHIAEQVPGAQKAVMPATAHLSPWEDPDGFVAILREFLAGL